MAEPLLENREPAVAVCCSVLRCVVAVCYRRFREAAEWSGREHDWASVMQCNAVCCSVLQCVAEDSKGLLGSNVMNMSVLQYVAVCCSMLQCVAVCCSVLPKTRSGCWDRTS